MKHLLALLLCIPPLLSAQTAPSALTPEQIANITKQLDQLEDQILKNRGDALNTALAQFRSGAASEKAAVDFYISCYKLVNFDRKDLKVSDFQAWKDRSEGLLKDPEFATALRLQLEYLVIAIQAQQTEDPSSLVPSVQAFLPKAVAAVQNATKHTASGAIASADSRKGGRPADRLIKTLEQSVKNSEFSKAYLLENHLTLNDWEYGPLNIAGIYDKIILPNYLKHKPAEISTQWDNRISGILTLRKATQSETDYQVFYSQTYPDLCWSKATYLLSKNLEPVQALASMLKIIRENPTHPKAAGWITELRQHVNQSQPTLPSPNFAEPTPAS